jgi:hypothetical protein
MTSHLTGTELQRRARDYALWENEVASKRSAARAASYQLAIIGKVIWKIGPDVYRIRSLSALIKRITACCRDEIANRLETRASAKDSRRLH